MPELMNDVLQSLKDIDFKTAFVTMYIVSRKIVRKKATYEAKLVKTDNQLRSKLKDVVVKAIQGAGSVREYEYVTADLDDDVLGIETSNTDLASLIDKLSDSGVPTIEHYKELLEAFFYIIRVDVNDKILYAARRVSATWGAKKVSSVATFVFKNNVLVDIDQKQVFQVDGKVDFISYQDTMFILDKGNFETVLNFRDGMVKIREEFVAILSKLTYFENPAYINELVGDNVVLLRKLSQAKKSAYYSDATYMASLMNVVKNKNWPLEISGDGKIIISRDSVELVLRLLNNGRLESLINHEEFYVDVKKPV